MNRQIKILSMQMLLLAYSTMHVLGKQIKFTSPTSTIKVSGKATITAAKKLVVAVGTISQGKNATLEGNDYEFDDATFMQDGGANVNGDATLNPNINRISYTDTTVSCAGGTINQTVAVAGKNAKLEGFTSSFQNPNTIQLDNSATNLNIALTSPLTTNIALNNGTITLVQDLKMSGTVSIIGNGIINYAGRSFILDGAPRTFGGKLIMQSASDLVFNGKLTLTGEWTFSGDAVVNGNGNILDISQGGTIRIRENSVVSLTDLKLRGLGLGKILFDAPTSQVRLSNVEIEMNRNYTVTIGGIYAEGPTEIVTKDKLLVFDLAGSLTVDGIALMYDTLTFTDHQNIRPRIGDSGADANITSLNSGVVRRECCENLGDIHIIINVDLDGLLVVSPTHQLFFDETATLNGQTNIALFTKAEQTLVHVADGKTGTFKNIFLEYFSPSFIDLGTGSALLFDTTKIDLAKNEDLNMTLTFIGNCTLRGEGHVLTLTDLGNIVVSGQGSSLLLEGLIIKGVSGNKIRCTDNTCTISFNNVQWIQDGNFSFTTGRFEVLSDFDLLGSFTFNYRSNRQSQINTGATLILENGITFSYGPGASNRRDLLALQDSTAVLFMNGATLASTTTGLQLTKGILMLDHKNFFQNNGAVSTSQGIAFGDGILANDLLVQLYPGANINVLSGLLVYQNTN